MDLYDSIFQRKSCREYVETPLADECLKDIRNAIEGFKPLYPDVLIDYRFAAETKGLFRVKAPHYLIISGQGKEGEMESAGFLFQQLALWFDANELGCVWLGQAKDVQRNKNGKDIVAIAFGRTVGLMHRAVTEFKRKPIEEVTNTPEDARMKAVHFAPSGMNLQPWYLEKQREKVLLYEQILKTPLSLAYKKTKVDMGIALCHYALASRYIGKSFFFRRVNEGGNKEGYKLFGEIVEP